MGLMFMSFYHSLKQRIALFSIFLLVMVMAMVMVISPARFASALAATDSIFRIEGSDRYHTAVQISQTGWDASPYAVLVSGHDFADALCAVPLAGLYQAPILLTHRSVLPTVTQNELIRLGVQHVFVIGGYQAISQQVENILSTAGIPHIERLAGQDRYETSLKILSKLEIKDSIALVSGQSPWDALSFSIISAVKGIPIVLTKPDGLPASLSSFLETSNIEQVYVIGGETVIQPQVERHFSTTIRLGGRDRYETNLLVLQAFEPYLAFRQVYLVKGDGTGSDSAADALCTAPFAARSASPLLLTHAQFSLRTASFLTDQALLPEQLVIVGGAEAVSDRLFENFLAALRFTLPQPVPPSSDSISSSPIPRPLAPIIVQTDALTPDGYYKEGDTLEIMLTFSQRVAVEGIPLLRLGTGFPDSYAVYSEGTGSLTLTFHYTVQHGDHSATLDYATDDALLLNGGAIHSLENGLAADLTLPEPGQQGSLSHTRRLVVDTTPPWAIIPSNQNAIPAQGDITLSVLGGPLSEASWSAILERIKDNTSSGCRWVAGVVPADLTLVPLPDGTEAILTNNSSASASILADFHIPAAEVVDRAGNTAVHDLVIDAFSPTITRAASATPDGYYNADRSIALAITFNANVLVTGTPLLALAVSSESERYAVYSEGSGSDTLIFHYTVQAGDNSFHLDYCGNAVLLLNEGMITETNLTPADLSLPLPGTPGSLSYNSHVAIDTLPPSTILISAQNTIPAGGSVTLTAVDGPLANASWIAILNRIKTNTITGSWVRGILASQLSITPSADGVTASLNNMSTSNAVIVADFVIPAADVVDRAGNTATTDIIIDAHR